MSRDLHTAEVGQMQLDLGGWDAVNTTAPEDEAATLALGEESQTEAGTQDAEPTLNGPDMRELLGEESFSEISRAVGARLGRALWRQMNEAEAR